MGEGVEDARGRGGRYSHNGGRSAPSKPIDGKPATVLNGGTIGIQMKDAAQAEAWHKAGVANGGTSIEDPPGVRPHGAYLNISFAIPTVISSSELLAGALISIADLHEGRSSRTAPVHRVAMASISFTVNAQSVEVTADGRHPRCWNVLRNHLGLTGTRFGCGLERNAGRAWY